MDHDTLIDGHRHTDTDTLIDEHRYTDTLILAGAQEISGWGTGNQWLGHRKSVAGPPEISGCGTGNQWLGHRKSVAGAYIGNQWSVVLCPSIRVSVVLCPSIRVGAGGRQGRPRTLDL